jgi:lysozyme
MSKAEPVFGIDIAYPYQKDIDLGLVKEQGYKFVVAKATEGPYRDGTSYTNPLFSQWRERAEQQGLIFGAYAFLVETPAKPQADLFLKTAGDVSGMILMLDFEPYNPPYQYLTPGNETLREFIAELRSRVGKHPIVLYSARSFWNGGSPSGAFDQYDADVAWDAYYWSNSPVQRPRAFYSKTPQLFARAGIPWGWGKPWGNVEPMMWQFTPAGLVAGLNLDIDAFQGTEEQLLALTKNAPDNVPIPQPTPVTDLALVGDALEYVEACVGGPYIVWEGSRFTNSAPAWVATSSPPPADVIRSNGGFCACIPTLMQRKAGIFEVDDTNAWYGGVLWYGEHYIDRLRVAEPFDINGTYGPGDLFIRRYTGPALQGQGHVAVMSSDSMHLIQSDAFEGVPHPGINKKRTLGETEGLLNQYDGGGFQWVVSASNWLKPKGA